MNETYTWYQTLLKPSWAPPSWIFGPVWSALYILIAISFGYVFYLAFKRKLKPIVVIPFVLNIIFNALFTPIQFGLRNNELALLDILLVLATIIWSMKAIYTKYRWVAYMQIPYFLWVMFATFLQITITVLNG